MNYLHGTKLNWIFRFVFKSIIMKKAEGGIIPDKKKIKLTKFLELLFLSCVMKFASEDFPESFNAFYWVDKFKQNIVRNSLSIRRFFIDVDGLMKKKMFPKISCKILKADLFNFSADFKFMYSKAEKELTSTTESFSLPLVVFSVKTFKT